MNAALLPPMLAALPPGGTLGPKVPGSGSDLLMLVVAIAALGLVVLGIAMIWLRFRPRHARHHRHHHRSSRTATAPPAPDTPPEDQDENGETSHPHRRRRRRRAHRGRNPTLAETGGLPPPRPEGQTPPGL